MVEPCINLIDFSLNCEWSNISTMIVELTIAGIMAIGLSIFFYRRQDYQRKKIDMLFLHQQNLKYNRHIQITENISKILYVLKNHFETMNKSIDYYLTSTSSSRDLMLDSIRNGSIRITEDSKKLSYFLSKYRQEIDLSLELKIETYLKSITNINFENNKSDQFMTKSTQIIKQTEDLITLNKQISDAYRQNEFWGKNFKVITDEKKISKINKLENEKIEEKDNLQKLEYKYWNEDQHPHNEDLKKNYEYERKILENKINDINDKIKKLKFDE